MSEHAEFNIYVFNLIQVFIIMINIYSRSVSTFSF